jgi:ABC-type spermidine/putrescine transport system permease subunit II
LSESLSGAGAGRLLLVVFAFVVGLLLLMPIAIVLPLSIGENRIMSFPPQGFTLEWYAEVFESPRWASRLGASLQVGITTAIAATVLGTLTAVGLSRARVRGKRFVYGLVLLPLIVPSVTVGIGMYFVWIEGWQLGPIGIGGNLVGSPVGYALAHTVLALPYPFITVTASLATVDRNLELAAGSLGASPWVSFRRITLPLIFPGVIAGLILSFLTSWDEVIVAILLASPRFATIPVELFGQIRQSPTPTAAALSTLLMVAGIAAFVAAMAMRRRATNS